MTLAINFTFAKPVHTFLGRVGVPQSRLVQKDCTRLGRAVRSRFFYAEGKSA